MGITPGQAPVTDPVAVSNAPALSEPLLGAEPSNVPNFGQALSTRTRVFGAVLPLWVPLVSAMGLIAVGFTVLGWVIGPSEPASAASVPPSAAPPAVASASAPPATPAKGPSAEAPASPPAAPKELTGKESAAEVLSVAELSVQHKLYAARAFRERLKQDPAILKDKASLLELRKLTQDPDTAREALAALAELPGPLGADILYEVWTGTPHRNDTTELARSLVYAPDIRAKASPALSVALDLRQAETCEQNRELLGRATSDGDRRSFSLLAKLKRKQGCGPNKRQDCYPCLREGTELDDAIKAVKTRRAPAPFAP